MYYFENMDVIMDNFFIELRCQIPLQVEVITGMVVGMMHIRVVCQGLTVVEAGRAEDGDHTTEDMTVEMEGLRMGKLDMVVSQVQKLRTHQEECSHKQEEVALGGPVGGSLVVHSIVFFT